MKQKNAKNTSTKSRETGKPVEFEKVFYLIRSIYDSLEPECLKSVGKVVYKKVATPVVEAKTSSSKYKAERFSYKPTVWHCNPTKFVAGYQKTCFSNRNKKNKEHLAEERRREKKRGEDDKERRHQEMLETLERIEMGKTNICLLLLTLLFQIGCVFFVVSIHRSRRIYVLLFSVYFLFLLRFANVWKYNSFMVFVIHEAFKNETFYLYSYVCIFILICTL